MTIILVVDLHDMDSWHGNEDHESYEFDHGTVLRRCVDNTGLKARLHASVVCNKSKSCDS